MYINIYMYAYNIQNILYTLFLQKKKLMVTFTIFTFTLHYIVLLGQARCLVLDGQKIKAFGKNIISYCEKQIIDKRTIKCYQLQII